MNSESNQSEAIAHLKKGKVPHHVAIVMDGNGRWAKQMGRPRVYGHQKGVESVHNAVKTAGDLGVKILTLYAFSEENWGRPKAEVAALMTLLETYVVKERDRLLRANVQFRVMGDLDRLPQRTRDLVLETRHYLSKNDGLILNIALSYGARSEIVFACRAIAREVQKGRLNPDDIDIKVFEKCLWTDGLADPDLLIRTSGEQRLSNFLLWQMAYTELYFSPVFWPEFRQEHFLEAVRSFQARDRRFGLVREP